VLSGVTLSVSLSGVTLYLPVSSGVTLYLSVLGVTLSVSLGVRWCGRGGKRVKSHYWSDGGRSLSGKETYADLLRLPAATVFPRVNLSYQHVWLQQNSQGPGAPQQRQRSCQQDGHVI